MRTLLPAALLLLVLLGQVAALIWGAGQLPAEVASHFDARGVPDNWMSRESHLLLMALFGLALPLALAGAFYAVRYFPVSIVNLPHREYWLAEERRAETSARIFQMGLWIALFEAALALGTHIAVVNANLAQPVRLDMSVWLMLGLFLAATAVWLWVYLRSFARLPAMDAKR